MSRGAFAALVLLLQLLGAAAFILPSSALPRYVCAWAGCCCRAHSGRQAGMHFGALGGSCQADHGSNRAANNSPLIVPMSRPT